MQNENIKYTIAIPAFKKQYLKECIDSALNQSYRNFEIIIVNDASPENLDQIVNQYSDSRIHYYRNEIGFGGYNVVDNWNKCLEYATGDYIICMGDDDKLLPNCLYDYTHLIYKYPQLDVYHTRTEIIDENSNVYNIQEARPEVESVYSMMWHRWHGRIQYIGDFLFKTNTLRKNNGFFSLPTGCCSDEISAYIAAGKKGIANTLVPGFQYRNNRYTLSNCSNNMRGKLQAFLLAKEWYVSFFENQKPQTRLDKTYYNFLIKQLNGYIATNVDYCIRRDIQTGGLNNSIYWFKNRREFNISIKYIFYNLLKRN